MRLAPTWNNTNHLLGEYDGTATEIFVVGLPISQLSEIVAVFSELPLLEITSFENETLELPRPFDGVWRSRLESIPSCNCQHSLRSANGTARHLQIYLWADVEGETLEVELVFWNDLTFPRNLDASEREQRLGGLVRLAEACRTGVTGAHCILAPEHNGSPEELLDRDNTCRFVW